MYVVYLLYSLFVRWILLLLLLSYLILWTYRRSKQIKQGITIIRVVTARAVGVQITSLDFTRLIFRRGDHNLNTAVTSSEPLSLIYICTRSKTGLQRWRLRAANSWWVHRVHLQACVRHWPVPWQSARVPRRYVHVDWEKTKRRENTWRLKILAVYLRPNERTKFTYYYVIAC